MLPNKPQEPINVGDKIVQIHRWSHIGDVVVTVTETKDCDEGGTESPCNVCCRKAISFISPSGLQICEVCAVHWVKIND